MKLVTNKFKPGGLHEKHVVATWNNNNSNNNNNNNNNNNKLQLVCHPVAVVILHVYKI